MTLEEGREHLTMQNRIIEIMDEQQEIIKDLQEKIERMKQDKRLSEILSRRDFNEKKAEIERLTKDYNELKEQIEPRLQAVEVSRAMTMPLGADGTGTPHPWVR